MRNLRLYESSAGQGLLELVAVVCVFGATVAVALPAYMGFNGRKADKSAHENLAAAAQMAEAYRADHGSYRGMDVIDLRNIDPRLSPTVAVVLVRPGKYCLAETVRGKTWSIRGPLRGDAKLAANGSCA